MPDGEIIYWYGKNTGYTSWKTSPYINSTYKEWGGLATTPEVISVNIYNCIHFRVLNDPYGGIYYCTKQVDLSNFTKLNCIFDASLGSMNVQTGFYNAGFVLNPNTYYSDSDSVYTQEVLSAVGSKKVSKSIDVSKTGKFYPYLETYGGYYTKEKHLKLYAMWLE